MKTQSSFIIFRPDPILKNIIKSAPGSLYDTLLLKLIRWTALFTGITLTVIAILLILDSFLQSQIMSDFFQEFHILKPKNLEIYTIIMLCSGMVLLLMGSLFLCIARLSKTLLNRQRYQKLLVNRQAELDKYVASQEYISEETRKMSEELSVCRA